MTNTTLRLYEDEFRSDGLEYYFEQYYGSIERAKKRLSGTPYLAIANMNVSFSDFMAKTIKKDVNTIFEEYKLDLGL